MAENQNDDQVENTENESAEVENTQQPTWDEWLAQQPEDVQQLYADNTKGLKSALDKERASNKENAKKLKRLDKLEAAEKDRLEADMSENDKLKAENQRLTAEIHKRDIVDAKRQIAAEVGLPPELAPRITGADEEEMRQDAEALLELLPKPEKDPKKDPKILPNNPITGQEAGETKEQRMNRLYGGGQDVFDPGQAAQHGGGAFVSKNE